MSRYFLYSEQKRIDKGNQYKLGQSATEHRRLADFVKTGNSAKWSEKNRFPREAG